MATYNDIKSGDYITVEGTPFMVLDTRYMQMQQNKPTVEMRMKNLKTGQVLTRTFKSQHEADEAEIEKTPLTFIYENRGEFWFCEPNDKSKRFSLQKELLGESAQYLKTDLEVTALKYKGEIINIELPIKVEYKVIDAPPNVKGDTASGGNKPVTIDSVGKSKVSAPLFINQGDIIRVNTRTGEYADRAEKSSSI